jgi:hypothetical protein
MALNCILPQQYESYSETWDVEYEDEYRGNGGISSAVNTKIKANRDMKKSQLFKIIKDKDRTIHPNISSELKLKLNNYFKLNVIVVKGKESHLQDGTYIDNLTNYSMLYNAHATHTHKKKKNINLPRKLRAYTV